MGFQAERMLDNYYVDKAILSCKGADFDKGVTDPNELEAGVKKKMLAAATTRILAVDSGKFGRVSFTKIVDFSDVDIIVTDYDMNEEWEEKMRDCNVKVVKC